MKLFSTISFLILISFLMNCHSGFKERSKDGIYGGQDDSVNLFAIIGEKLSVIEFDPNSNNKEKGYEIDEETGGSLNVIRKSYVMDRGFRCKYKVVKELFNKIKTDTIEFVAYDHYGIPGFSEKETVILYLSKSTTDGHYYHQKYQYDNIFKDKNGNYFSYPTFYATSQTEYAAGQLKGFPVKLNDEKFNVADLSEETRKERFPESFYKIENNFAYPVIGITLPQLINYRLKTTFRDL